jgi:hypothetical protein
MAILLGTQTTWVLLKVEQLGFRQPPTADGVLTITATLRSGNVACQHGMLVRVNAVIDIRRCRPNGGTDVSALLTATVDNTQHKMLRQREEADGQHQTRSGLAGAGRAGRSLFDANPRHPGSPAVQHPAGHVGADQRSAQRGALEAAVGRRPDPRDPRRVSGRLHSQNWPAYTDLLCAPMRAQFTGPAMDYLKKTRAESGTTLIKAITNIVITGDTAAATIESQNEAMGTRTVTLPLKLEDGWKICRT